MRTVYLGKYNKFDGYNDNIATIHAVYDLMEGKVVAVHPSGSYTIESRVRTIKEGMEVVE